ncbi:hypothetical protein NDU88_000099, partial [Pleurodeles waltl]
QRTVTHWSTVPCTIREATSWSTTTHIISTNWYGNIGSVTMSRKEQPAVTSATWIGDIWSGTTHWVDIRH